MKSWEKWTCEATSFDLCTVTVEPFRTKLDVNPRPLQSVGTVALPEATSTTAGKRETEMWPLPQLYCHICSKLEPNWTKWALERRREI